MDIRVSVMGERGILSNGIVVASSVWEECHGWRCDDDAQSVEEVAYGAEHIYVYSIASNTI